jgi:hypothetical protein
MSSLNGKKISSTEVSVGPNYAANWELLFGKKNKKEEDKCSHSQEKKQ